MSSGNILKDIFVTRLRGDFMWPFFVGWGVTGLIAFKLSRSADRESSAYYQNFVNLTKKKCGLELGDGHHHGKH